MDKSMEWNGKKLDPTEVAACNAIRRLGWLARKDGPHMKPLADAMCAEPGHFGLRMPIEDVKALLFAARTCGRREDTIALMRAYLPARVVSRWAPEIRNGSGMHEAAHAHEQHNVIDLRSPEDQP
jgi:hypothetical protein